MQRILLNVQNSYINMLDSLIMSITRKILSYKLLSYKEIMNIHVSKMTELSNAEYKMAGFREMMIMPN